LEQGGMGLVGQSTGRRWQLGDAVKVRLIRVDLTQRQIDFELVDANAAASRGTVRAPRRGGGGGPPRRSSSNRQGRQGGKRGRG
jgi:ribonuclease R